MTVKKTKKKHILVISQYFYPEKFRINDICLEWKKRGYDVTVLTGMPNYPEGQYYDGYRAFKNNKEEYKGISIIRLPIIPRGNNSIMLSLNYLSFVILGYIWKVGTRIKPDRIFIYEVSPVTQALPGLWLSKKRKIPVDIYVLDLWPESFQVMTGINNKIMINSLNKLVKNIYNKVTNIYISSPGFKDKILEKGNYHSKIKYWPQYAEDVYFPAVNNKYSHILKKDFFNITYAGNIGYAQGLDILPTVAKELKKLGEYNIKFNIVGNGRFRKEFESRIKEIGVSDMFFMMDPQPQINIPYIFAASDVSFISLSNNDIFNVTLPAKLQSSLACGIPILGSANGTMKQIINQNNIGLCSDSGDVNGLLDNILKIKNMSEKEFSIMKRNTLEYYENNFSKEKLLEEMDNYIGRDENV